LFAQLLLKAQISFKRGSNKALSYEGLSKKKMPQQLALTAAKGRVVNAYLQAPQFGHKGPEKLSLKHTFKNFGAYGGGILRQNVTQSLLKTTGHGEILLKAQITFKKGSNKALSYEGLSKKNATTTGINCTQGKGS
jgi:hypothetical protein